MFPLNIIPNDKKCVYPPPKTYTLLPASAYTDKWTNQTFSYIYLKESLKQYEPIQPAYVPFPQTQACEIYIINRIQFSFIFLLCGIE